MPPGRSAPSRLLRTRVGRRFFLLFLACAMLPLGALAFVAHRHVMQQIEDQAYRGLRSACKTSGMTLLDRILTAASDLETLLEAPDLALRTLAVPEPQGLGKRLRERFLAVEALDAALRSRLAFGDRPLAERLDATMLAGVAPGSCVVVAVPRPTGPAEVLLLQRAPRGGELAWAAGLLRPEHLWAGEIVRPEVCELVLADGTGAVLFDSGRTDVDARAIQARLDAAKDGPVHLTLDGRAQVLASWRLYSRRVATIDWTIGLVEDERHHLAAAGRFYDELVFIAVVAVVVVGVLSTTQIRRFLVPIERLARASRAIEDRRYETRVVPEGDDELTALAAAFNRMAGGIEHHLRTTEQLNRLGIALSAERDEPRLLRTVIEATREIIPCSRCAVFLEGEGGALALAAASPEGVEPRDLAAAAAALEEARVRSRAERAAPRPAAEPAPESWRQPIAVASGCRNRIALPVLDHEREAMGVLLVVREPEDSGLAAAPFAPLEEDLAASIASQAGVALAKNRMVGVFKGLFEGLIEMIALAIDEKSPYTGDHCRRVPALAMALADAVQRADSGPLADFRMSEDELYELQIAALLHDCGKIVTPVHVVDKATKLETIFDRIALVDARFEILRRDAEILVLREALAAAPGTAREALERRIEAAREALLTAQAFIRRCNVGVEHMPEPERERVRQIARAHSFRDAAGERQPLLTEDEVENLTVHRGTLTAKEREVVNHHAVATVRMLESLPYPKELAGVPLIAGSHHECMDGSGYPRGLGRDALPIQARVLAIADIFEALTAKDRPYKKGKPLSESLAILGRMKLDGRIDPDVFDVFVREEVYLRYAREHLDPAQIDAFDPAAIPGWPEPAAAGALEPAGRTR